MTRNEKIKAGVQFGDFVQTRKMQRQFVKNYFKTNKIRDAWTRLKAQELDIEPERYLKMLKGKSLCTKNKLKKLRMTKKKMVLK